MFNKEKIRNAKNFDELLDIKYGKVGSEKRDNFEEKVQEIIDQRLQNYLQNPEDVISLDELSKEIEQDD